MAFCEGCGNNTGAAVTYCSACGLKRAKEAVANNVRGSDRLLDLAFQYANVWLQNKVDCLLPVAAPQTREVPPQIAELPEEFQATGASSLEGDATYSEAQRTIDLANELRRTETATRMANMVMESNRRMWDDIRNMSRGS